MRKSVIAAAGAAATSLFTDWLEGREFSDRKFIGFTGAVVALSLFSGIEALGTLVDVFAYLLVTIVLFNDGFTLLKRVVGE